MLAIFILNVHDLPFSLPLERPPSKQSDQQKCCRGISSLLHIEDFTFLLPSPPHSCSLELEQTYAGSPRLFSLWEYRLEPPQFPSIKNSRSSLEIKSGRNAASTIEEIAVSPTSQPIFQDSFFFFQRNLTHRHIYPRKLFISLVYLMCTQRDKETVIFTTGHLFIQ